MKLQLKRSNVLVNGAAKTPTASQLDFGELAINYSANDPVIFLKDSNNQVIRISGIGLPDLSDSSSQSGTLDDRYLMLSGGTLTGNITLFADPTAAMEAATKQYVDTELGNINIPSATEVGTVAPTSPDEGALWWDTNDGRLYVYYTDANSSQWIPAVPETTILAATVINTDDVEYYLTGISGAFDGTDDEFNYSTSLSYNPDKNTVTSPKLNGAVINPGAYTTTARNSLTGLNAGDMIFNSSDSKLQIWNGTVWEAAGGASVSPPSIGNVVLTEQNTSGDRFTSEAFSVAITMLDEGAPVSQKGIKGKVTAQFQQFPSTTAITAETVSTSASNIGNSTKSGSSTLNNGYWVSAFQLVDPSTNAVRCFMWIPDGSNSNDDMLENASKDLVAYTVLKNNFYTSFSDEYPRHVKANRLGTFLNVFGRRDDNYNSSFNISNILGGNPSRSSGCKVSTDAYIYDFRANGTVYRTELDGSNYTTISCTGINGSGGGMHAIETLSDRVFIIGRDSTSNNLWYRELTDAQSASLSQGSYIYKDGSISTYMRNEVGCVIWHKGAVITVFRDKIRRFTPGNSTPQSYTLPSAPSGYVNEYYCIWEDPFGNLIARNTNYNSSYSARAAHYYSSNNSGATWVANAYPTETSGHEAEFMVPDNYLYGRRQRARKDGTNNNLYYYVTSIRSQTVTVTDGADLSLLNVGDVVKKPGATNPMLFAKIGSITSNGNGTTDIVVNGFDDFATGDFVEATASTGNATSTRFLVINSSGAVTTTQSSDPGFTQLGPGTSQQISFPATFPTGNTPDSELPAGTTLQVEVDATNSSATDTFSSNIITPA